MCLLPVPSRPDASRLLGIAAGVCRRAEDAHTLCYEGGIEISDEEMITGEPVDSYQKFISLILKYELNNFAPHQERLADITQKKAEQIALFKTRRKKNKKKADDNSHDE